MSDERKKKTSPSEELLRGAGGADDDYTLTPPSGPGMEDEASSRMSAEEIAALLSGAAPTFDPDPPSSFDRPPPPPPPPPPVERSDPDSVDRWSTPSGDWTEIEAQNQAKRASRLNSTRRWPGPRAWIAIGIGAFVLIRLFISAVDGKERIEDQTVGDCFVIGDELEVGEVDVVDCTEPHTDEVYAIVNASSLGATFPGDEALFEWIFNECLGYFQPYTGQSYEESRYYADVLIPTPEGWREGDREGVCTIVVLDDSLNVRTVSGSARNSGARS